MTTAFLKQVMSITDPTGFYLLGNSSEFNLDAPMEEPFGIQCACHGHTFLRCNGRAPEPRVVSTKRLATFTTSATTVRTVLTAGTTAFD
jgi:hypothetical protein